MMMITSIKYSDGMGMSPLTFTGGNEKMKRPKINKIDLKGVMADFLNGRAGVTVTMSPGQWDKLLQAAYDVGYNLIEVDDSEIPIRAYRKKMDA